VDVDIEHRASRRSLASDVFDVDVSLNLDASLDDDGIVTAGVVSSPYEAPMANTPSRTTA
jgi:hypothetical protein